MAIDNLLAAILAMDAYNRRYDQAIAGLPPSGAVRDATIVTDSQNSADGFYGIEYSVNGQKSHRLPRLRSLCWHGSGDCRCFAWCARRGCAPYKRPFLKPKINNFDLFG